MKLLKKLMVAGVTAMLTVSLAIPASARYCRADGPHCGVRNGGYSCGVTAAANVLGQTVQETAAQFQHHNTCPMVMLNQQGKLEEFQAERARLREECAVDCPQGGVCVNAGTGVCIGTGAGNGSGSGQGAGAGYGCGRGYGGGHHGGHHGGRHH